MKTGTHSVMKTALKKGSHSSHYSHHSHNSHNSQNSRSSDRLRGEWRGQKGMARWWRPVVLAVVCFFTFFVNNGVLVPDIMESRNLITAREMVAKGNYLVPTMNGELRLAKPPLPTWIAAAVEEASPDNIVAQRCAAGVAGVMLTIFLYLLAARITRIDPLWPTLLLLTCYNVVLMGRTASWDIFCHAFMLGGIYFLARALLEPGRQTASFCWAGIFTGLSIMSKGPVSLYAMLLPWLIATLCCRRVNMRGKWSGVAVLVIVALLTGGWWYAYIYLQHKSELQAVAAQESGAWMNRNVRPWWYYHKFYLETGIWALLLISAIVLAFTRRVRRYRGFYTPLVWMLAALVLLSVLPEKKMRYLLPVLVPAALVMGQLICRWIEEFRRPSAASRADKVIFRLNAWLLAIVTLALPVAAWYFCYRPGYMALWALVLMALVSLVVAVCIGFAAVRLAPGGMVWGVAVLFVLAEGIGLPAVKPLINNADMRSVRLIADRSDLRGVPFFSNAADELRIEMVYAARRDITPVAFTDSALQRLPLPAVILTHRGAKAELPADFLQRVDTVYIGRFDDNRRPEKSGRYTPKFIYHLTYLRPKTAAPEHTKNK